MSQLISSLAYCSAILLLASMVALWKIAREPVLARVAGRSEPDSPRLRAAAFILVVAVCLSAAGAAIAMVGWIWQL